MDILKDVLNLTLRGIKKTQIASSRIRLPITTDVLSVFSTHWELQVCARFHGALLCDKCMCKWPLHSANNWFYQDISFQQDTKLQLDYVVV